MKNRFEAIDSSFTFDDSNIFGGITFRSDLCDEDINLGTVLCNSIEFKAKIPIEKAERLIGKMGNWYVQWINSETWVNKGYYIIDSVKYKGKGLCSFKAYDKMIMFEKNVDAFIEAENYPVPLFQFVNELAEYCGFNPSSYPIRLDLSNNENFLVKDNFRGTNISGRQILSYIAQVGGGFAHIDEGGFLKINPVGDFLGMGVDNSLYKKAELMNYSVQPINWLIVQANDNDYGVQARSQDYTPGDRDNVYKITNNPLLYTESEAEIKTTVNNILAGANAFFTSYTPGEITLFEDFNINCGELIYVDDKPFIVTGKVITEKGVKLTSSGNEYRAATGEEVNPSIVALRGKTNELIRDVEHTKSTLTDQFNNFKSSVEQTAQGFEATVEQTKKNADAAEKAATTVKQTVEGLTVTAVNGEDKSTLSLKAGETVLSSTDIKITGAVTFNDLSTPGKTTINGGNIKTGTISSMTIESPTITGEAIKATGSFQLIDEAKEDKAETSWGYMGKGTGLAAGDEGGDENTTGVIMASGSTTGLGTNSKPYLIVTDKGVRMQAGQSSLFVCAAGAYVGDGTKTTKINGGGGSSGGGGGSSPNVTVTAVWGE